MVKFIAEIGSNSNSSLERASKLIEVAKDLGCWAVKFQLFNKSLYAPQCTKQQERLQKWKLPLDFIPAIAKHCKCIDIKLGFSVFYLHAVEILEPFVDFFKIGSFELTYLDLIKAVAHTGKPVILSTGMGTDEELRQALNIFDDYFDDLTVLHCDSNYPALPENCNLRRITWFRKNFRWYYTFMKVGWSDHTCHPGIIYAAIAHGAEVIEFHLDLEDGKGWESEYGHCWLPSEIKPVIDNVRIGEIASQPSKQDLERLRQQRTDTDGIRPMKEVRE